MTWIRAMSISLSPWCGSSSSFVPPPMSATLNVPPRFAAAGGDKPGPAVELADAAHERDEEPIPGRQVNSVVERDVRLNEQLDLVDVDPERGHRLVQLRELGVGDPRGCPPRGGDLE